MANPSTTSSTRSKWEHNWENVPKKLTKKEKQAMKKEQIIKSTHICLINGFVSLSLTHSRMFLVMIACLFPFFCLLSLFLFFFLRHAGLMVHMPNAPAASRGSDKTGAFRTFAESLKGK